MRTVRSTVLAALAAAVVVWANGLWLAAPNGGFTPSAMAAAAEQPEALPLDSPADPSIGLSSDLLRPAGLERYIVIPEESRALYRVGETLFGLRLPDPAVGITQAVSGELLLDRKNPASTRLGAFIVDISQLRSDEPGRDRAIRERWLESARFPLARFQALSLEGLPESLGEGEPVPVVLHGELTIRNVTRLVAFRGSFAVTGDTLRGTARATIRMTDFGFEPPSILGALRASNEVEIEVEITARRSD